MRTRFSAVIALVSSLLVAAALPATAQEKLYRWTDEEGNVLASTDRKFDGKQIDELADAPLEAKTERRQSAAGQVAGLIHDVKPVGQLFEELLAEARDLAERLPGIAAR